MAELQTVKKLPWQHRSFVRGNLALAGLRDNLLLPLKKDGRIHAETALTVFGAVVGSAAHQAAKTEIRHNGQSVPNISLTDLRAGKPAPAVGLLSITYQSGQKYFFGDLLNRYLVPQPGFGELTLWALAAGAAIENGLPPASMPKTDPMFAYVTKTIDTPQFGFPNVAAQHRPQMDARNAATSAWPFAEKIFRLDPPEAVAKIEPPIEIQHLPLLTAVAASQFLKQIKGVLDSAVALTILMESAIAASKIGQN